MKSRLKGSQLLQLKLYSVGTSLSLTFSASFKLNHNLFLYAVAVWLLAMCEYFLNYWPMCQNVRATENAIHSATYYNPCNQ